MRPQIETLLATIGAIILAIPALLIISQEANPELRCGWWLLLGLVYLFIAGWWLGRALPRLWALAALMGWPMLFLAVSILMNLTDVSQLTGLTNFDWLTIGALFLPTLIAMLGAHAGAVRSRRKDRHIHRKMNVESKKSEV